MLKSYFTVAIKHLLKQKLYTSINVIGLGVGLACFILIALYVRHELSYDARFANAERIVRVSRDFLPTDVSKAAYLASAAPVIAPLLKEDFAEIEQIARLMVLPGGGGSTLRRNDGETFIENGLAFADPELFQIFGFEWLRGDPRTALSAPDSIVLTAASARKYFGAEDPIGKTLLSNNATVLQVTGVIADLGDDTHLDFTALRAIQSLATQFGPETLQSWGFNAFHTYALLPAGVSARAIVDGSDAFFERHFQQGSSRWTRLDVLPLRDIHLRAHKENELRVPGSAAAVQAFVAIAAFILLLACINFTNLATARSAQRAKEIGVRKVVGADRAQVVAQFLVESMLVAGVAFVLALALVELALPSFNALAGTRIAIGYFDHPGQLALLCAVTLATGLLAGSYPALYLAAFEPGKVLKGDVTRSGGAAAFRKALVVLQFAISIALLIATAIVYEQMKFARGIELGFDKDRVLIVDGVIGQSFGPQWEALEREWLAAPEITHVTRSNLVPGMENTNAIGIRAEGHDSGVSGINNLWVDYDFFETYAIGVVAGRVFGEAFADQARAASAEREARAGTFVINELAARRWGWSAEEAIGKWLENPQVAEGARGPIVGVVKDVYFESIRSTIEPTVYLLAPEGVPGLLPLQYASLRLSGSDLPGTLARIDAAWAKLVPERPIARHFLDQDFEALYRTEQRQAQMLTLFSSLAILIACLGLFGLASFTANRRTKEIGIRKTIGGSVTDIVVLLTSEFGKLVLVANVVAWPVAYFMMQRWLASYAYRIDIGLAVFVASALCAFVIACVTVGTVAARAASVKPVNALRYE